MLDAVSSLVHIELASRPAVRAALRASLVKDSSHEVLFQRAFEAVFVRARSDVPSDSGGRGMDPAPEPGRDALLDSVAHALREGDGAALDDALDVVIQRFSANGDDGRSAGHHTQRVLRRMSVPDLYRRYLEAGEETDGTTAAEARVAMEQLSRRLTDLLSGRLRDGEGVHAQQWEDPEDRALLRAGADELAAMRATIRPLARRLATRLGAQHRSGGSGLDMRKTIRASMSTGGVPVRPALHQRRPSRPDVLVLCDVSGSTAQFAPFTLTLLNAFQEEFRHLRSFAFIDGIVEITGLLAAGPGVIDPHHLLTRRGLIAQDGRSDYARALTTFLKDWGSVVSARTTVIIAGDARSHEHAPATAMVAELRYRARRLYWLNPEPRTEWDTLDSRASEYAAQCTDAFAVATIRQLATAVTQIF
ncbi:VWA domain-containing protein [Nocardioides daejeonensis]|uniref:VWA domain-containing protein n=1 Tax=Nocardioides daejeonensis TaxID=1046556 RepID=UPI0013A596D6|nr:VWA domain-containing protein [Nocardioides daejeonensis]